MNLLGKPSWVFLIVAGLALAWPRIVHAAGTKQAAPEAWALTTELASEPLGLDVSHPRFSWKLKPVPGARGQQQTAYRLLVATAPEMLKEGKADIFDSGRIASGDSVLVEAGNLLILSHTKYYWTIRLWDEAGREGSYAPPASFETGILDQSEWFENGAKWIESPLQSADSGEVEDWADYVVLRLKYQKASGANPTEADYDRAARHYRDRVVSETKSGALMRREFDAHSIKKARLYITGLGYYRAYLNGRKIGDRDLAPSDSHFFANVYYQAFDITDLLKEGKNCLGVELVNGRWKSWFGMTPESYNDRPVLMARLELTDADGRRKTIVTDEQWNCGESPLLKHGFWIGELYDARKEQQGWKQPGFAAPQWVPARAAKVGGKLRHFTLDPMPPEKMGPAVLPVRQTEPKPGVYVYHFGRMIGGRAQFKFKGLKTGQRITVRYSEAIDDTPYDARYGIAYYGTFDNVRQEPGMLKFKSRGSVGSDAAVTVTQPDGSAAKGKLDGGATAYVDRFISAGKPEETWVPNFTYTGFRYLEVLGLDSKDQLVEAAAYDLRTEPGIIGSLTTDHAKLNEILKGAQDTLLSCFHSQFQDNNGAERNPNALNVALNDANAAYWMNTYPLWHKVASDTDDANTCFDFAVNMVCGMRGASAKKQRDTNISNSLHYGHLPYNLLAHFNDDRDAARVLRWTVRFVKEASEYMIWNNPAGSSDHIAESSLKDLPSGTLMKERFLTSPQFVKSSMVIRIARMGIEVANRLNKPEEAAALRGMLGVFEKRVAETFHDPQTGQWTADYPLCQGRNVCLLYNDMHPRPDDQTLAREIVREIHQTTNGHQVTGSRLSYPLLHVLSWNGFENEALRLLTREEYPSLLDMIRNTSGTIRESWGTLHSFAQIEGLSAMSNWFYTDLVGIEPSLAKPAFGLFTLKPVVPDGVGRVDFSYESPRGKIESRWARRNGRVEWNITVPPNAKARLVIPAASWNDVLEGGKPAAEQEGISWVAHEEGRQVFEILSGTYRLEFGEAPKTPQPREPYNEEKK